jgi:hypothetical protein
MGHRIDGRFTAAGKRQGSRPPGEPPADAGHEKPEQKLERLSRWGERFVAMNPGLCLVAALAAGVMLGWLIKRR